jgi:hypothetical protein
MENYITPKELRAIADYCETLTPLWEALTTGPKGGVSVDHEDAPFLEVHDANGEFLGTISWADSGAAFYPKVSNSND